MGGKPRTRPTDIVALAKELRVLQASVAKQEQIAAEATALLASSKAALTETRAALLAAAKAENPEIAAAIKSPRVPKTTRKKSKRRAKPKSAAHWGALQTKLVKAMKTGRLYSTSDLQELAGCANVSKLRFVANVRKPLIAAKKIKKTVAKKGNRSPRNVRWVKA